MSANKTNSLHFYDYLCRKIGSEKEVKVRRLTYIAADTSMCVDIGRCDVSANETTLHPNKGPQISSGSKSEGLDLKGSDIDMMYINADFIVYESERDAVQSQKTVLVMDTENTQPCFTRLNLYTNYNGLDENDGKFKKQHGMNYSLPNDLYKQCYLGRFKDHVNFKIHGPCLSDDEDLFDFAFCLKCNKWISIAVPWIHRPRSSWLSSDIISKITMSGVLFVPIGLKGSRYENLEWRISFSVAEKFLIFSFNHTQLLCYALLKIVLKEIIETGEDLKGLLCSYYIKTMVFWILDESDGIIWRPDNIIKCFSACLQRLLYSVEYSTLLHYFIPDYNFLDLRVSADLEKKKKLTSLLKHLYQHGIQCFSSSETLHDYCRFPTVINKQASINSRIIHDVLQISCSIPSTSNESSSSKLLNILLNHSQTEYCSDIFLYFLSRSYQYVPKIPYTHHKQHNKQQYLKYKYDISRLLIGLHSDAIAWLMLASFFYVHENYLTSLDLINYALSKITDEKCALFSAMTTILTPKQESAIDMMKNEKLITTLKSLTINYLRFAFKSQIVPKEIQQDVEQHNANFHPKIFAHFLRFLCYYHLHDFASCANVFKQLALVCKEILFPVEPISGFCFHSSIFFGIATQMMDETDMAKKIFERLVKHDIFNLTTAALRLNEL